MHPEAWDWIEAIVKIRGLGRPGLAVVDIGGANRNGTVRDLFPGARLYVAVDVDAASGVDVVADATDEASIFGALEEFLGDVPVGYFDVVVSTETLEHVRRWPSLVENAARLLAPTGELVLTSASTGRGPHAADGSGPPRPGEWYRNVSPEELRAALDETSLADSTIWFRANPGDVYAHGVASTPVDAIPL